MATEPPIPPRRPVVRELFGHRLVDDYAWMRERDSPQLRAHLEAESTHALAVIDGRGQERRAQLYAELRGRIQAHDQSVPSRDGPWFYYSRTEEHDEYPRHCRREAVSTLEFEARTEHVYLDENELAKDHEYFDLAALSISPNHRRCAYIVDLAGDEVYTLRVMDLDTGALLDDQITGCGTSLTWFDDETLLYSRLDSSHRPWQAWSHRLGDEPHADELIHQEDDGQFYLALYRTRSDAFVVMSLDTQVSSEVYLIPLGGARAEPLLLDRRADHVEYGVAHGREGLFILSNRGGRNFCVEFSPIEAGAIDLGHRRTLIAHRDDVLIEDIDVFARHLVVWERKTGLQRIRVVPLDPVPDHAGDDRALAEGEHLIAFDDPTYSVWATGNAQFETQTLRFAYTSLTTPTTTYDYELETRERSLKKRQVVVGGHRPEDYASRRIWAEAEDGARVPISLVWRREDGDRAPTRPRPLILYAYGAYGETMDPSFSSSRKSLLDRGAIWAIAHVRGGGDLGRAWYEAGKLEHKHNTFEDYIACAHHLIAERWTSASQLAGMGGSAGGLLIGAVANQAPSLFEVLIADVPFVDVLNTMLDPELPLTLIEREEWGNPETAEGFAWIHSYSPYDNVTAQDYPHMLVLAGWNDPRVGYWEPAKWVARLRERKRDAHDLLLWTNMDAGHGGASGRFEYLHELALEYAFLITRLGLGEPQPVRPRSA